MVHMEDVYNIYINIIAFVLCARRKTGISLQTNQSYCESENKTVCGTGDNLFCVSSDMSCPVSELGFTTNSSFKDL